ncbi:MAG: CDP-alcohol phosphatidyltransferase family protein [Nanoarchaeota archaeon]
MKWSIYSECEKGFFSSWHKCRVYSLHWLLVFLTNIGITANIVSMVSAFSTVLFVLLIIDSFSSAVFLLILHIILDGVDGPLATYQKTVSNKGMFVDFSADLVGIASTTLGLMIAGYISPVWSVMYLFFYTVTVFFGLMHTVIGIKQPWSFRPRLWVYGAVIGMFVVEVSTGVHIDMIQIFVQGALLIMCVDIIYDFKRLYHNANNLE